MKSKIFFIPLLFVLITMAAFAQSDESRKEQPTGQQSGRSLVSKVFDVKHRNPESLMNVVNVFVSGQGRITFSRELKTIMIRDLAENVAAVEDALKRFDVPEQSPVSLEFQLHLIAASMGQQEKTPELEKLGPALVQLRSALKFSNYRYINSTINRVSNGGRIESTGVSGTLFPAPQGVSNTPDRPLFYQYTIGPVRLTQDVSGKDSVQIENFRFGVSVPVKVSADNTQYKDIGIITPLSLREGETVVVGTANVSGTDEAIVVIISVKKVK